MTRAAGPFRPDASLDAVRAMAHGTLLEALGIEIVELGRDFIRGTLPVDQRTRQPFGLLHGGASVALAETLGSIAAGLCIDPAREMAVGLEINANHVRAVTDGTVTGTARPLHLGRSTQVWDIRIEDAAGRLVCVSRLTIAVVPRR
ncbi:1,4-dihydroxy-2-naphthoyl-CoA hydrolase [Rehaibacterium terrae]|uniref:1,4-dihydroxy-2-naphthoyl-CoA hydrolase n=2 Tax=Rehaibacterium terrae TaxID=1341696 RepID=A0A7W7XZU4_9GAMM|nr:1,4-dihydroxy-2-naphthoyl-CoA hydrolase [Rehaibacterium terrae]